MLAPKAEHVQVIALDLVRAGEHVGGSGQYARDLEIHREALVALHGYE